MQTPRTFQQKMARRLRSAKSQLEKLNVEAQTHKETSNNNLKVIALTSFCATESIRHIEAALLNLRNWKANPGNRPAKRGEHD